MFYLLMIFSKFLFIWTLILEHFPIVYLLQNVYGVGSPTVGQFSSSGRQNIYVLSQI